jgi:hypothetical protein
MKNDCKRVVVVFAPEKLKKCRPCAVVQLYGAPYRGTRFTHFEFSFGRTENFAPKDCTDFYEPATKSKKVCNCFLTAVGQGRLQEGKLTFATWNARPQAAELSNQALPC